MHLIAIDGCRECGAAIGNEYVSRCKELHTEHDGYARCPPSGIRPDCPRTVPDLRDLCKRMLKWCKVLMRATVVSMGACLPTAGKNELKALIAEAEAALKEVQGEGS